MLRQTNSKDARIGPGRRAAGRRDAPFPVRTRIDVDSGAMRRDMMAREDPHAELPLALFRAHARATAGQVKHDARSLLVRITAQGGATPCSLRLGDGALMLRTDLRCLDVEIHDTLLPRDTPGALLLTFARISNHTGRVRVHRPLILEAGVRSTTGLSAPFTHASRAVPPRRGTAGSAIRQHRRSATGPALRMGLFSCRPECRADGP